MCVCVCVCVCQAQPEHVIPVSKRCHLVGRSFDIALFYVVYDNLRVLDYNTKWATPQGYNSCRSTFWPVEYSGGRQGDNVLHRYSV